MGEKEEPSGYVQRAVWGTLYADDAGCTSMSAAGRATMMAAIMTVFEVASLTESKTETKTMLFRAPTQTPQTSPLDIEKASERYIQTSPMLYLGGVIHEIVDLWLGINRRLRQRAGSS